MFEIQTSYLGTSCWEVYNGLTYRNTPRSSEMGLNAARIFCEQFFLTIKEFQIIYLTHGSKTELLQKQSSRKFQPKCV